MAATMNNTKEIHLRIRGLTDEQYHELKHLARTKKGTNSIARYTKSLLLSQIQESIKPCFKPRKNSRLEVRADGELLDKLSTLAKAENMTTNGYVAMLLQSYINKQPAATTAEVQALYQSNVQLVRIGNNLNQIAKALNLNQQTNLTTELLSELKSIINLHTEKVGEIIIANIERLK